MGRKKNFNHNFVVSQLGEVFINFGFEGTSIDDLTKATGLLRGSLYSEFGSKRGMFLAALTQAINEDRKEAIDLIIIALMELTYRDDEIRKIVDDWQEQQDPHQLLVMIGQAVLVKGKLRQKNGKQG